MPTIRFKREDLINLLGRDIERETFEDVLFMLKGEIEEWGEEIEVSIDDSERPDLWSVEGLARAVRVYLGDNHPEYTVKDSEYRIVNEQPHSRPLIVAAVVKNVNMNENTLEQLIQLQEKIMLSYGRNRRRVAIGTSNLDRMEFPLKYTSADPKTTFVPLGEEREMTLEEILHHTPKGREYAHLIKDDYPVIFDARGRVVTFPPIINSNDIGRIDESTRNIFIDVTGDNLHRIVTALNVMVTSLVERGGEVYRVYVNDTPYPDLSFKEIKVDREYMKRYGGVDDLRPLSRMGYKVEGEKVLYPPYRGDIRTQADILEDLLSAINYNNIPLKKPSFYTKGSLNVETLLINAVRDIMASTGSEEVQTFTLTDPHLFEVCGMKVYLHLSNPVTSTHSSLRSSLLPHLLRVLSKNTRLHYPQMIFEVGEIFNPERHIAVAFAYAAPDVSYTHAAQVLWFLIKKLYNREATFDEGRHPLFIEGRTATVEKGVVGEVKPEILEKFNINMPVAMFEYILK